MSYLTLIRKSVNAFNLKTSKRFIIIIFIIIIIIIIIIIKFAELPSFRVLKNVAVHGLRKIKYFR